MSEQQVGEIRVFLSSPKGPKAHKSVPRVGRFPAFYCTTVDVDKWFWFLGPLKSITETEQPSVLVSNSEYTPSVQLQRLQHTEGMISISIISVPTLSNLIYCRQNNCLGKKLKTWLCNKETANQNLCQNLSFSWVYRRDTDKKQVFWVNT